MTLPAEGLDNILVVDGVPATDKVKLEKLLQKISKDFSQGDRTYRLFPDFGGSIDRR